MMSLLHEIKLNTKSTLFDHPDPIIYFSINRQKGHIQVYNCFIWHDYIIHERHDTRKTSITLRSGWPVGTREEAVDGLDSPHQKGTDGAQNQNFSPQFATSRLFTEFAHSPT